MTNASQTKQNAINETPEQLFQQGLACHKNGDYRGAALHWQKAAEGGHVLSMYNLGCMYMRGLGVESNHDKGLELLRHAADLDNENARGVLRDFKNVGQSSCPIAVKAIDFNRRRRHILMAIALLLILVALTIATVPNKFM